MSKTWEQHVLDYDPFSADRDSNARRLRDKIVDARKPSDCVICREVIVPRTRARALTEVMDGQIKTFHCCRQCCDAMALASFDAGRSIERRTAVGMQAVAA